LCDQKEVEGLFWLFFQFGNNPVACPVAALLQATSIFVSTLSITAIALDRRQLIVKPHQPPPGIKYINTFHIFKKRHYFE